MFVTSGTFVPDPALRTIFSSTYPGWWDTPEKDAPLAEFNAAPDQKTRTQLWAKLQAMIYEEAPVIRPGNFNNLVISRKGRSDSSPPT
jgi:peptide/nickel transport system substrate-binding protein